MTKIIFDTDIGGDCDDTGALAIVHECERAGKAKLLAVTLSTASPYAAGCADAINRWYGHEVPIGQTKKKPPEENADFYAESYGRHISEVYGNAYKAGGGKTPEDAVRLLRRVLAENRGEKISLVVVGCCINIAALIKSGGDDISPLSGRELLARQAKELSLMGCFFPSEEVPEIWFGDYKMEAECNIQTDIEAARTVFAECPVPVSVAHYLVGWHIHTGGVLIEKDRKNPVAESYFVHSHGNRDSWDLVASYVAIFGADGIFSLSERGRVTIDERGVSAFVPDESGMHRLVNCPDFAAAEKRLDGILLGDV